MKIISVIAFIILSVALSSCSTKDKKDEDSKIQQAYLLQDIGLGYIQAKNYPAALKHLLQAEKFAPNDPAILNSLAIALNLRGRPNLAIGKLQQSLKIDPKFTEGRTNLSQILIEQKKYSQALRHLLVAREDLTYERPEKVHANLGIAYYELSDHMNADKELNLALKANRNYCRALVFKVKNLFQLKQFAKASRLADNTSIRCSTSSLDQMLYYSGVSLYQLGKLKHAKNRFNSLNKKFPDSEFSLKAASILNIIGNN